MANPIWVGQQAAVKQKGTFTVTADDANTTYKITIGTVVVSVAGSGVSTTQTATNLTTALIASTAGMFSEITWTSAAAVITGLANTAGTPFTATSSVSGGTGTLGAYTAVTANTSPNDVNDGVNWSTGSVPGAGDTVWIDGRTNQSLLYNLGSLSAVAVATINVAQSFTGQIGLKEVNTAGTAYTEYRTINWQIQFTTLNVGYGPGSGSGLLKFDPGSALIASTVNVYGTGSAVETGRQALSLLGTNAANVLNVWSGTVGVAPRGADSATYATINCGPAQGGLPPTVVCGVGATLTTVSNDNGTLTINSACTTLNHKGGSTQVVGSGAITTVNASAGTVTYQGTGTVTTFNATGCTVNLSDQAPAVTITNCKLGPNTTWLDRGYRGVYTNGFALQALARLSGDQGGNVVISVGPGRTYTIT